MTGSRIDLLIALLVPKVSLGTRLCCDILVRSLAFGREHKGPAHLSWVVLDNHFHAIVAAPMLASEFPNELERGDGKRNPRRVGSAAP